MTDQSQNLIALAVAAELKRRISAATSLLGFTQFTFPKYQASWHHRLMCSRLDDVVSGKVKRLMIFTPPRHGKTELAGRRLPAYAFGRNPDIKIVSAAYSSDLACATNRDLQRVIDDDRYRLVFPETSLGGESVCDSARGTFLRNTDEFEIVNHKGYYKSVGVMTGLTGRGFNIGIIDDPVKDRLEAGSKTYRDRVWDWYNSVFFTRRENDDAAIIVIQTRWHQDDLSGRLLEGQGSSSIPWEVVSLPAVCEEEHATPYDLRKADEALWPGLFDRQALREIERQLGSYEFSALYQQRPSPREGGMFKTQLLLRNIINEVPAAFIRRSVRYWDKAGSQGAGCFSAGVLIHEMQDGTFVIADVTKGQWSVLDREERIRQCALLDGHNVKIWTEQEPGSGGKESAEATVRGLAGYVIKADKVTGDKVTRAEPLAAQVEAGNVFLLNRPWVREFVEECELFPNGKYKDQVDSASGAFNKVCSRRIIRPHAGSAPRAEESAGQDINTFQDILAQAKTPVEREELLRIIKGGCQLQEQEVLV
jgi:predicted phage terminase large subunit-like protein